MSMILKGIDMHPKFVRTYRIYPNGEVIELANDGMRKSDEVYQAIQIPKDHGDIKDVGKLEDELDERCGQLSAEIVRNAPTILEAEEE